MVYHLSRREVIIYCRDGRGVGGGRGEKRGGGGQLPVLRVNRPKKSGARSARTLSVVETHC
jgi:hypothetical protein